MSNEPSPFSGIHRLLPQSPDAEQGLLSSCLIAPQSVVGLCREKGISEEYFHIPAHGRIYWAILELWDKGAPVDFITVTQFLRDVGELDQVGGADAVTTVFRFLPTAVNAGYYLKIIQEKFMLRQVIRVGFI